MTPLRALFSDALLKPKHHYLLHYPELKFRPLIRLWSLRFKGESHFSVLPLPLPYPFVLPLALVPRNRVVSSRGENIPL